jgi:membrane protease YdiL (CAAX protease family)
LEQFKVNAEERGLPLWVVFPGLLYIFVIDVLTVVGIPTVLRPIVQPWSLVLALIPWVTLVVLRWRPSTFGFRRRRALADFGWGILAGAIWRAASLGFNYLYEGNVTELGWGLGSWILALVWIPLVEETFFRGYLGRSFSAHIGRWPGIIIQAILFSLHPGHWTQGWPHLASIFIFGILAGWLVERRGSIWPAWGAHAFANILPQIMRFTM